MEHTHLMKPSNEKQLHSIHMCRENEFQPKFTRRGVTSVMCNVQCSVCSVCSVQCAVCACVQYVPVCSVQYVPVCSEQNVPVCSEQYVPVYSAMLPLRPIYSTWYSEYQLAI